MKHTVRPHRLHYAGIRHLLKYLFTTRTDGIYFWRAKPNMALTEVLPPRINSNMHDLMLNRQPVHQPLNIHSFMDVE